MLIMRSKKNQRISAILAIFTCFLSLCSFWVVPPALALDYNRESLINVDFSGRDLRDGTFTKAVVRNSDFSNTNLQGVSLFGATFKDANLTGADLRNATLDTARFVRSNLTNALLEGAFAFNARFDRSTIDGADFTDVMLREDTQEFLCSIATGTNPITGRHTRDTLLCQ